MAREAGTGRVPPKRLSAVKQTTKAMKQSTKKKPPSSVPEASPESKISTMNRSFRRQMKHRQTDLNYRARAVASKRLYF